MIIPTKNLYQQPKLFFMVLSHVEVRIFMRVLREDSLKRELGEDRESLLFHLNVLTTF